MEERRAAVAMRRIIHSSTNCIDVGSHMGAALREMTRLAPNGRHLAFETDPHKAAWLRTQFPQVVIHDCELSDVEGARAISLETNDDGYSAITVATRRLDDLVPEDKLPGFIRIELTNTLHGVIQGATNILTAQPILLLAAAPDPDTLHATTLATTLEQLRQGFGYLLVPVRDWIEEGMKPDHQSLDTLISIASGGAGILAIPDPGSD